MSPTLSYQASTHVQNNVFDTKNHTITHTTVLTIMQSELNQTVSVRLFCQYYIFPLVSAPSFQVKLPKHVVLDLMGVMANERKSKWNRVITVMKLSADN